MCKYVGMVGVLVVEVCNGLIGVLLLCKEDAGDLLV